jgi:hypothetical protein
MLSSREDRSQGRPGVFFHHFRPDIMVMPPFRPESEILIPAITTTLPPVGFGKTRM